ncbi:hypothetical protein AHF37_03544 [Paragonimus kellicotti]|nr:hypothetical protein AHF37_03544 [Paragonimus kellicotti]
MSEVDGGIGAFLGLTNGVYAGMWHYYTLMLCSVLVCLIIHHVLSPYIFGRHNRAYREFSREKRMEWDSRLVSTIHATLVSVLCISTLFSDREIWTEPLTHPSTGGLTALSLSVGYFLCDLISMPLYWRGMQLFIFTVHHLAAIIAFMLVVQYRVCVFFGVYRLTTELSTPFTNQRWFYRTIGYKPDRRRVCTVTLMFAILFAITRNLMIVPFWYIAYQAFTSPAYMAAQSAVPWINWAFVMPPLTLDILNLYWARKTYRIGWRAAKTLWHADWRTDIRLAHARLRRKLRRLRQQRSESESTELETFRATSSPSSFEEFHLLPDSLDAFILESSSESEYEAADDELMLNSPSSSDDAPSPVLPDSIAEESRDQFIRQRPH